MIFYFKKVREKSRGCHSHKPQPFPDIKRKRKPTNPNKHKSNKRTKNTTKDIQQTALHKKACVKHGHGGLWNSIGYDTREVTSIDMKSCYPASFQGMGGAKPYFERLGLTAWPV